MGNEKGKRKKETLRQILVLSFFLFPFSLFLGGCAVLGVAAHKLSGPQAVEAQYKPAGTPMLVLVENYQRQSNASVSGDRLAQYIAEELARNNVAPVVPLEQLAKLRESRPDFARMSISAIGNALDAAQVLYVQLMRDEVTPLMGGEALQGQTVVRVKVVDAPSGSTLWPTDLSDGYELSAATQLGADNGRGAREVQQRLHYSLADQIAKLFYKWKPEE